MFTMMTDMGALTALAELFAKIVTVIGIGAYEIANNQEEKLFWAYKCWIQVLERAEKDSGLRRRPGWKEFHSGNACEDTDFKMMPVYIMAAETGEDRYDFRLLRFSSVLEGTRKDGMYQFPLSEGDRADLPGLKDVLFRILLPEKYEGVLQER